MERFITLLIDYFSILERLIVWTSDFVWYFGGTRILVCVFWEIYCLYYCFVWYLFYWDTLRLLVLLICFMNLERLLVELFYWFCVFERDPLPIILNFYGVLLNFIGCISYSLLFQGGPIDCIFIFLIGCRKP